MAMTPEFQAFMEKHFSLDNYTAASELDLQGWYDQFMKRNSMYSLLRKGSSDFSLENILANPLAVEQDWWTDSRFYIDKKRDQPIRDWRFYEYWLIHKVIEGSGLFEQVEEGYDNLLKNDSRGFRDYRAGSIAARLGLKYGEIPSPQKISESKDNEDLALGYFETKLADFYSEQTVEDQKETDYEIKMEVNLDKFLTCDLKVDLTHPDEVLKNAFKEWLETARLDDPQREAQKSSKRKFNDIDIKNWLQFRTLSYIDLELASRAFKCSLNDDEIAYFLLPDLAMGVNSRDKLRAVKKHAAQMSNYSVIQRVKFSL